MLRDLVHEIDYAGWLYGWPRALQARVRNMGRLGIDSDEVADLMWEGSSGCLVSINLDYLSKPARRLMSVYGERGTMRWDGIAQTVKILIEGEPPKVLRYPQSVDEMFVVQAQTFIKSCQEEPDPRLVTGQYGAKALAVCDAARLASHRRREERVEYR